MRIFVFDFTKQNQKEKGGALAGWSDEGPGSQGHQAGILTYSTFFA